MGDLSMAVALDLQLAAAVGFSCARGLPPLWCCQQQSHLDEGTRGT